MLEYKGYKIAGESIPMYMAGCDSLGTVYGKGRAGSIIEVARIEGQIFKTMKEAEDHGLELARGLGRSGTEESSFFLQCSLFKPAERFLCFVAHLPYFRLTGVFAF